MWQQDRVLLAPMTRRERPSLGRRLPRLKSASFRKEDYPDRDLWTLFLIFTIDLLIYFLSTFRRILEDREEKLWSQTTIRSEKKHTDKKKKKSGTRKEVSMSEEE